MNPFWLSWSSPLEMTWTSRPEYQYPSPPFFWALWSTIDLALATSHFLHCIGEHSSTSPSSICGSPLADEHVTREPQLAALTIQSHELPPRTYLLCPRNGSPGQHSFPPKCPQTPPRMQAGNTILRKNVWHHYRSPGLRKHPPSRSTTSVQQSRRHIYS